MLTPLPSASTAAPGPVAETGASRLWVDGVGVYQICVSDVVRIGGPVPGAADVALLAQLSATHATLRRSGEGYILQSHGPCWVDDRLVLGDWPLGAGCELRLGESVRLRFRMPSPLSRTACLDFLSDHRPWQPVDGVILCAETCLLGPGSDTHIPCPDSPETILLIQREGTFFCKSRGELFLGEQRIAGQEVPLSPGTVVTAHELRFHLERVGPAGSRPPPEPRPGICVSPV